MSDLDRLSDPSILSDFPPPWSVKADGPGKYAIVLEDGCRIIHDWSEALLTFIAEAVNEQHARRVLDRNLDHGLDAIEQALDRKDRLDAEGLRIITGKGDE